MINPERPLEYGLAMSLINPFTGNIVHYDECDEKTGTMIEAKAASFDGLLQFEPAVTNVTNQWLDQSAREVAAAGTAGSVYPMWNGIMFGTHAGVAVNEAVATYPLMKRVALSMIACWEPAICFTRSSALTPDFANEGDFAKAWISYVTPADAASVPISSAFRFASRRRTAACCYRQPTKPSMPTIPLTSMAHVGFRGRRNTSTRRRRSADGGLSAVIASAAKQPRANAHHWVASLRSQ